MVGQEWLRSRISPHGLIQEDAAGKLYLAVGRSILTAQQTCPSVMLDDWEARKPEIREAVANLRENLEDEPDPVERADIRKHIEMGEKLLGEITQAIPD